MVYIDVITPSDAFINGLIKVNQEFLGEPVTDRLTNEITTKTNYFINSFFLEHEIESPQWETVCHFDDITMTLDITFRTMNGQEITPAEAMHRINEFGNGSSLYFSEKYLKCSQS